MSCGTAAVIASPRDRFCGCRCPSPESVGENTGRTSGHRNAGWILAFEDQDVYIGLELSEGSPMVCRSLLLDE